MYVWYRELGYGGRAAIYYVCIFTMNISYRREIKDSITVLISP